MVMIEVDGLTAQIEDGVWSSPDGFLLDACEIYMMIHPWRSLPSNPNPDYDVAEFVVEQMGGKIVQATRQESLPNVIY
jgi:hypothetical protein